MNSLNRDTYINIEKLSLAFLLTFVSLRSRCFS